MHLYSEPERKIVPTWLHMSSVLKRLCFLGASEYTRILKYSQNSEILNYSWNISPLHEANASPSSMSASLVETMPVKKETMQLHVYRALRYRWLKKRFWFSVLFRGKGDAIWLIYRRSSSKVTDTPWRTIRKQSKHTASLGKFLLLAEAAFIDIGCFNCRNR